jgi:uncharacterized protein
MISAACRLRLDPWTAEYDGSIQLPEPEWDAAVLVDLSVETAEWGPRRPPAGPTPERMAFVDGVRRVEHRLLGEEGERMLFGLLGSLAVGATLVRRHGAVVAHESVHRVLAIGGGVLVKPLRAILPDGRQVLSFEPEAVPENSPIAPVQALQAAMRRREAQLAGAIGDGGAVVFLDGPLTFLDAAQGRIVGFVKRLLRSYLPAGPAELLRRLAVGQRTPVFLIRDTRRPRYSWYLKIAAGRPIESSLAGVVRLETWADAGLAATAALADLTAREIPRFASTPDRDPRAPQNLHPIGGLEARLRHLMGDALVVRRAIEAQLQREVA